MAFYSISLVDFAVQYKYKFDFQCLECLSAVAVDEWHDTFCDDGSGSAAFSDMALSEILKLERAPELLVCGEKLNLAQPE